MQAINISIFNINKLYIYIRSLYIKVTYTKHTYFLNHSRFIKKSALNLIITYNHLALLIKYDQLIS